MPEFFDIYDRDKNRTGKTWPRGMPMKQGDYRLVGYAWIMNQDGFVLLTRRHPDEVWGGYWECTGGGVQAGETSLQGMLRELKEEIGVSFSEKEASLLHSSLDGNVWVDSWIFNKDPALSELRLQPKEVTRAIWVCRAEYERMRRQGVLVPACTHFYEWLEERKKNHESGDGKNI